MYKILVFSLISMLLISTGCATYFTKQHWNEARKREAVRIEADGTQVLVGVDLTALAYLKDNWKWAVPAAVIDGVLIYQTYQWVDGLNDSGGSGSGNRNNSVSISGNSESSISVSISGDTTSDTRNDNDNSNNSYY